MIAMKCDVCGKFFMPYLEEDNALSKTYSQVKVNTRDMGMNVYSTDHYDLCEDCSKSLDKWLGSQGVDNAEAR